MLNSRANVIVGHRKYKKGSYMRKNRNTLKNKGDAFKQT